MLRPCASAGFAEKISKIRRTGNINFFIGEIFKFFNFMLNLQR